MAENPYAAPAAKVADVAPEGEYMLADRTKRLAAAIVDGILVMPFYFVFTYPLLTHTQVNPVAGAAAGLYAIVILVIDLILLYKNAQTIGKKLLKIKIARKDGSQATVGRIFWLRGVVNAIPSMIPYLRIYGLIDVLFIFGEPRRCLHDYIADTIVIDA